MSGDGVQATDLKRVGKAEPKVYVHKDGKTIMIPAEKKDEYMACLLYTSPSPRDLRLSRMPSSA